MPTDLYDAGVSFERWAKEMQILYTTPPINPVGMLVFSPVVPTAIQAQISAAVVDIPSFYPSLKFQRFEESTYNEFQRIISVSGIDVQSYLAEPQWTPETAGVKPLWKASPSDTVMIDVHLHGGIPFVPFAVTTPLNFLVLSAIYAELVRMDTSGQYFPYLAEGLPTLKNGLVRFIGSDEDQQLEVEFRLRPNLRWQDGQPLTADDLAFSWNLVMNPAWPSSHQGLINLAPEAYVDSVEAPAPDRIIYRFMSQRQAREAARTGGRLGDPPLYADLAQQVGPVVPLDYLDVGRNVFPRHLLEGIPVGKIAESDFARRPVYAGAYRLVKGGGDGEPVVLEAFDDFALGKPKIARIVFGPRYFSEGATTYWQSPDLLADALKAGAIQAQLALPAVRSRAGEDPRAYDELVSQGLADVDWAPRNAWEVLDFNLDNPHLADVRVRQAITHAINRQALIDQVLAGHGELMRSYLPRWHPLYAGDAALPDYAYDPDKARALLKEAGYDLSQTPAVHPTRGPLVLRLASMDVNVYPRPPIAALIQEQLAAVGIQGEVKFYSWPEFEGQDCSAIRNGRQFDLGMAGWLGAAGRYPIEWVEQATASESIPTPQNGCPYEKSNWSGWRNAEADAILAKLKDGRLALEQPEEYKRLWAEHQKLWASELPSLPLFNSERPVTTAPQLQSVQPSPFAFGEVEDTWNIFEWFLKPK